MGATSDASSDAILDATAGATSIGDGVDKIGGADGVAVAVGFEVALITVLR